MINLTREEAQNVLNLLILWLDEQEEPDTETAVELLRARLSEPEPEPVAWLNKTKHGTWSADALKCEGDEPSEPLYTAPPQQHKQEPVAWMWDVYNGAGYSSRGIGFQQTDIPFAKHTPLYTKKEWVGLTHEEKMEILTRSITAPSRIEVAEALLKEKNSG